jgi:hypothetical protein
MRNRIPEALDIVYRTAKLGEYDCNVIGMAAEIIAEDKFGMTKTSRGKRDVDGTWFADGRNHTVQVKAWSESRVKRYKQFTYLRLKENALPDVLLCILVYSSKRDYEILYNGTPSSVGYVEKNGLNRVIRFDDMRPKEEIVSILRNLGLDLSIRESRPAQARVETRSEKQCSICGTVFPIEEFNYGGRTNNSYCKECRKGHGAAYARGGSEETRRFREQKWSEWKS